MRQDKIIALFGIIADCSRGVLHHESAVGNGHFYIALFFDGVMPSTILWVKARSLLALGATMAIFKVLPAAFTAETVIKETTKTSTTINNILESIFLMGLPPYIEIFNNAFIPWSDLPLTHRFINLGYKVSSGRRLPNRLATKTRARIVIIAGRHRRKVGCAAGDQTQGLALQHDGCDQAENQRSGHYSQRAPGSEINQGDGDKTHRIGQVLLKYPNSMARGCTGQTGQAVADNQG